MSGHSKFTNIKHKKEKNDAAKGKIFTVIGREIAVAVKEGGADPANNSKLRDVIAKAKDETHIKILKKLGADMTVLPEYESGIRIARHLATGNVLNFVELSDDIRMVEISIRGEWAGHSLKELDLRKREHINVIALRSRGEISTNPDPDKPLEKGSSMLITVDKKVLNRLTKE